MCGDMYEAMAQAADDLGDKTVLRTEDVDSVFGMLEGGERFGIVKHLDTHRNAIFGEQLKRPGTVAEVHPLVSLQALFPRQALILGGIDPVACPHERVDVKARAGTDGGAHVVGIFGVDQHNRRSFHVTVSCTSNLI
jgi:hypothetical protein